jgi:hypothetical protein
VPVPVPDAGPVKVTQGNWLVAVHEQLGCDAVTVTVTVPPAPSNDCASGEIEKAHGGGAAACVTVKVWPAMVAVPVLASPLFAANDTAALPLPDPLPDTTIHPAFDADVHVHVGADAVTVTVALLASGPMLALLGAIVNVQGAGGAAA